MNISFKTTPCKELDNKTPDIININIDNDTIVPIDIYFLDSNNLIRVIKKGTKDVKYVVYDHEESKTIIISPNNSIIVEDEKEVDEAIKAFESSDKSNNVAIFIRNQINKEVNAKIRNLLNGGMH